MPNITFGATANTVIQCGAKPIFADIEPSYWTIDPEQIELLITHKTRAIIPVHLYGHPCEITNSTDCKKI